MSGTAGQEMEEDILRLVEARGPLTGSEVIESLGGEALSVWRSCRRCPELAVQSTGRRYLRLDRRTPEFARLSPSIWREFLTYTVIGSAAARAAVQARARELELHAEQVSRAKAELAFQVVSGLAVRLADRWRTGPRPCFLIAGDIVHQMAHDVPRPERSTGKLVSGSDIDLVVVVPDRFPEAQFSELDEEIFTQKRRLLQSPHIREEIDYVVKRWARVAEQLRFDTFRHMVACKILQEGTWLWGDRELFERVKGALRESGVPAKLAALEQRARALRTETETFLLGEGGEETKGVDMSLFYPTDEAEEFE